MQNVTIELDDVSPDVEQAWAARVPALLASARDRLSADPGEAGLLYARHHLDELDDAVWASSFGLAGPPTVTELLGLLQPVSLWGDPSEELALDLSLGEGLTDYVLSFAVHPDGTLGDASMES